MSEFYQSGTNGPLPIQTEPSHKKRNIIIGTIAGLGIVAVISIIALLVIPRDQTKPVASAVDTLARQADALPEDLKAAISKYLGITPKEYLKQSEAADKLSKKAGELATNNPDEFAGAFLDENGKPHINFTKDAAGKNQTKGTATGSATYSASQLQSYHQQVLAWYNSLTPAQKSAVSSIAIDYKTNTVNVNAANSPAGKSLALPGNLGGGATIKLFQLPSLPGTGTPTGPTTPTTPTPTPPVDPSTGSASDPANNQLLAGDGYIIPIIYQGKPNTAGCSTGFSVSDTTGKTYALTSGHCKQVAMNYKQTSGLLIEDRSAPGKGTGPLGDFGVYNYALNSSFDYGLINLNDTVASAYKSSGIRTKLSPLKINGSTTPVQGAPICKSGRSSGWTCGKITAASSNFGGAEPISGRAPTIAGFATDVCIRPGDSGGPMVSGLKAVGITARVTYYNNANCAAKGMVQRGGAGVPVVASLQKLGGNYSLNVQ